MGATFLLVLVEAFAGLGVALSSAFESFFCAQARGKKRVINKIDSRNIVFLFTRKLVSFIKVTLFCGY